MKFMKNIGMAALIGLFLACLFMAPGLSGATSSVNVSGDFATGVIATTGSAVIVPIGWVPKEVVLTKTTNTPVSAYWNKSMADASCLKTAGTATSVDYSYTAVMSHVTVSCVTVYTGSTNTAPGFTFGADTDLNTSGTDTVYWRALR